MTREWFSVTRNAMDARRRNPFADPLDSADWSGLDWTLPLLTRMASGRLRDASGREGRARNPRIHTRSPFLIR